MRLPKRLGALGEREFRLFFFGQSVSLLGDGMTPLALAFAVLGLTGSVSDLGFVLAARTVPLVAFLLVGGVWSDRLSRRTVMLSADVVRLASQGLVAALLISGNAEIWQLLVLQAVNGSATAFFYPALTGLTPLTVTPAQLQEANALRGLAMSVGSIAGPAVAGALVATVGSGWAIAADAATFGISAIFLAQLRLPPHERLPAQPFLRDLRDGWREFRSSTWLRTAVPAAGLANMFSTAFFVLGAAISRESLGGAGAWALILAAFNAGSVVGGLVAIRVRPRRPLVAAFLGYLLFTVPSAVLAAGAPAVGIAAATFVAGVGLLFGNAVWETTLQQQVPPAALSRVTAYDWFGSLAFQPIGYALVGPVSAAIGNVETLWLSAASMLALDLFVLAVPSIRQVEAGVKLRNARGS